MATQTPRARLRQLLRTGGTMPAPLFLPLALALAARIEALDVAEFLSNPTKLAKGLQALHLTLETDGVTCAAGAGLEIEALGAELDWTDYPPRAVAPPPALSSLDPQEIAERVSRAPRIAVAVEATRRLAATCAGEPALVAALTGPGSLAREIACATGSDPATALANDTALLETAGRAVLEVARLFLLAGASVVFMLERDRPAADAATSETWAGVITPIANLARFHKALPVMLGTPDAAPLSPALMPCLPVGGRAEGAEKRLQARALDVSDLDWHLPDAAAAMITTDGEVPADTDIGMLRAACHAVRTEIERRENARK